MLLFAAFVIIFVTLLTGAHMLFVLSLTLILLALAAARLTLLALITGLALLPWALITTGLALSGTGLALLRSTALLFSITLLITTTHIGFGIFFIHILSVHDITPV